MRIKYTRTHESEKVTEPLLIKEVKALKGLCIKLVTLHFAGLPDRLVLLPGGIIFFVETKSQGDTPSAIQIYVHKKIRALGFKVYVADTAQKIKNVIDEYR